MMDNYEFSLTLLRRLLDQLKKLTAEQIDQLVKGTAQLTFVPPGATVVKTGPDVEEVRKQLSAARSRREAIEYLVRQKLRKADLLSLARQLEVAVNTKDKVDVLRSRIAESTAGVREDAAAFGDRSWRE